MATRYSGDVKISITWNDRADAYNATVSAPGFRPYHVQVGRAAASRMPVDSPAAYDSAAHAALSFADEDSDAFGERAQYNQAGTGWHITRSKSVRSNPARRHRAGHVEKRIISLLRRRGGAHGLPYDHLHSMLNEVSKVERVDVFKNVIPAFSRLIREGAVREKRIGNTARYYAI